MSWLGSPSSPPPLLADTPPNQLSSYDSTNYEKISGVLLLFMTFIVIDITYRKDVDLALEYEVLKCLRHILNTEVCNILVVE